MSQGPIVSPVPVMLKHPILARFDEISRDPAKVAAMRDLLSSDCDARALADVAVRQGICPPALAEHMLRYWANVDGAGWPGEIMAELRRGVPADLRGVAGRRTAAVVVVDPRADGGVPHARRADRGSAPAVHDDTAATGGHPCLEASAHGDRPVLAGRRDQLGGALAAREPCSRVAINALCRGTPFSHQAGAVSRTASSTLSAKHVSQTRQTSPINELAPTPLRYAAMPVRRFAQPAVWSTPGDALRGGSVADRGGVHPRRDTWYRYALPMLSVIIPTRDRLPGLRDCLEALALQPGAAATLEVIVVDDGGRQAPNAVVEGFSERLRVRCHRQDNAGPAAARNTGARLAMGEWLVFLDDDCRVTPGWLASLHARCRRHPEAMIGGSIVNALAADRYAVCHQLVLDYLYGRLNPSPAVTAFCASSNLAVPAASFRAVGGFDPGFPYPAGEDRDLCDRWHLSGRRLVHATEVEIEHAHAMTVLPFLRQHFGYGRGARRFHRLRSLRHPGQRGCESPGFYLGLLLYPFQRVPAPRSVGLFVLLLLSQLATTCGYAVAMIGDRATAPGTAASAGVAAAP